MDHNRANRHLAGFCRQPSLGQRRLHRFEIRSHGHNANAAGLAAGCCWVMQCSVPNPQTKSTQ